MVVLAGAIGLATVGESSAIVIRHDRDDARYLTLGERYPAVGSLVPVGDGVVTLIAPGWAITAAHVAEIISPFSHSVLFEGVEYPVEGRFYHPDWKATTGSDGHMDELHVDMALLKLAGPVREVTPVSLYADSDEPGKRITFIGWGDYGNGQSGPEDNDGKRRGARNTVSSVDRDWVRFLFDAPPAGDDLEGISGPGDSGGPALYERDGEVFIIGVGSSNDDLGQGLPECTYGTTELYARVSTHRGWIVETMRSRDTGEGFGAVAELIDGGWPETPAARVAQAFFDAWAAGTDEALAGFDKTYRTRAALKARPVEERLERWREMRGDWGSLNVDRYADAGMGDLFVLAQAGESGEWLNFRFLLAETDPPRLRYISIGNDAAPR